MHARGELFEPRGERVLPHPAAALVLLHKRRVLETLAARRRHRITLAALRAAVPPPVCAAWFVRSFMGRELVEQRGGVIELRPVPMCRDWVRDTGAPRFQGLCIDGAAACPRGTTCAYAHAPIRAMC